MGIARVGQTLQFVCYESPSAAETAAVGFFIGLSERQRPRSAKVLELYGMVEEECAKEEGNNMMIADCCGNTSEPPSRRPGEAAQIPIFRVAPPRRQG